MIGVTISKDSGIGVDCYGIISNNDVVGTRYWYVAVRDADGRVCRVHKSRAVGAHVVYRCLDDDVWVILLRCVIVVEWFNWRSGRCKR